jgi:hypothetical protein
MVVDKASCLQCDDEMEVTCSTKYTGTPTNLMDPIACVAEFSSSRSCVGEVGLHARYRIV